MKRFYLNRKSQWKVFVFSSDNEVDAVFSIDFCSFRGLTIARDFFHRQLMGNWTLS